MTKRYRRRRKTRKRRMRMERMEKSVMRTTGDGRGERRKKGACGGGGNLFHAKDGSGTAGYRRMEG